MFDCPLKSKEEDRFLVPEWAKGKVVYQIFPDRFAASHKVDEKLWYEAPVKNWRALYMHDLAFYLHESRDCRQHLGTYRRMEAYYTYSESGE